MRRNTNLCIWGNATTTTTVLYPVIEKDTTSRETTNESDFWVKTDRELKFDQQVVVNKARPYKKIIYMPGWTIHKKTIHGTGKSYSRICQCSLGPNTQERPTDD